MRLDTEFFSQRIQCSRDDKQECLYTVRMLLELASVARDKGMLAMDHMVDANPERYASPFLRKAVQMVLDVGEIELIERALYATIVASNHVGGKFLNSVIIAETMMALHQREEMDYIFRFLVPSFFGLDFEPNVVAVYDNFRQMRPKK